MTTLHEEFEAKHDEVLKLREKAKQLRGDLLMVEATLQDAERESAVLFLKLFNRPKTDEKPKQPSRREDWHYDSQGYCDNPGRGY